MDSKDIDLIFAGYSSDLNYKCRDRNRINDENISKLSYVLAKDNDRIKLYKGIRKGQVSEKSFDHIAVHKFCSNCGDENMTSCEVCNSCMNSLYSRYHRHTTRTLFDLRRNKKDITNIITLLGSRQHRLPYDLVRTLKAYLY